jgi:hypothetical protein
MFGKNKKPPGRPPESGEGAELDKHAEGVGGEGARNAQATPRLASTANPGQTSHPAPPDDAGVPPDEELSEEKHDD